jgi:hypothetical protein
LVGWNAFTVQHPFLSETLEVIELAQPIQGPEQLSREPVVSLAHTGTIYTFKWKNVDHGKTIESWVFPTDLGMLQ